MNTPRLGRLSLEDVAHLFAEGYGPGEIADQANVSAHYASVFMRRHGMTARPRKNKSAVDQPIPI